VEACCRRVHIGRGAHDTKRREPLPMGDKERDWGKTGFHRKYAHGRYGEAVLGLYLNHMPKGVQSGCSARAWCE